mgnify:CR=1 FL=1
MLFAGITVVISLLGMLLIGIGYVQGLAVTAAATVALTVAASVTLLPALLGFAGERIELTRWRGLVAAGFVAVAPELPSVRNGVVTPSTVEALVSVASA